MARPKRPDQEQLARRGLELRAAGVSDRAAAAQLGVNAATLRYWIKQLPPDGGPQATPSDAKAPDAGGPSGDLISRLRELARALSDASLHEHAATVLEAMTALAAPPAPTHDEPAPDVPPEPTGDTLADLRALYASLRKTAEAAAKVGNHGAAQRALRDAAALSNTITRLERSVRADELAVHVTQAEIEDARIAWRARVKALLEQPATCSECGARLREGWTKGDDEG